MADVALSAKMSNEELLSSIDSALKSSETKFTTFATDVNSILNGIGKNMGSNISTNFEAQINQMKAKVLELQNTVARMGSTTTSTRPASSASVNVNDYNGTIVGDLQKQDSELLKLNEHYRQLEINSKSAANAQRNALKMDVSVATKLPTNNLDEANEKLRRLQELKNRIASSPTKLLNPAEIQSLDTKIANLTRRIETMQARVKQPLTMSNVMGMSESNLNAISAKMKAINDLRGNYGKGAPELSQLNQAYQRLGKSQNEALTAGVQLETKNRSLASSFENLGRRVMFYAGLGAMTGFVTQLFEIRGEYEMLERSMGALLGNFSKGSELFNKIQAQALKSPLTVLDLSGAAKQLVAYNFAEDQVAETTKRLADLSTALGVPIERLVYNLGQIKSKNVLDARDARDFANAGFAIVPMLAQLYTEQKKFGDQTVTTAQVYDMMTKKMVSYGDVMDVINKQTNEGGMFFDFQAKQAQTLKGQLSNLVDAWNMMLNQMGKEHQGVMTGLVSGTRYALANWKEIERVITGLVVAYGTYKAAQLAMNAIMGQSATNIQAEILASKQKLATDLLRKQMTIGLTAEEKNALDATNKVSSAEYAAALKTKGYSNEQLMLKYAMAGRNSVTRQAIVETGQLSKEEIATAAAMGKSGVAIGALSVGFKKLTLTLKSFFAANWPMLVIMAAVSAVTYLINKHEEQKQKLQEVNDEYNNLRKNIADISVNFQVALQDKSGKGLDEAKTQLNELIKLAKDQYNITFNIDTSKIDAKQIVPVFNKIKSELDDLAVSARAFSDSALQSNIGDKFEKYGQDIQKVYDTIIGNRGTVIDALQSNIHKLQELGGQQREVQAEQSVLNNLLKPKQENESLVDYLNRLTNAYNQLGIVGSNTNPFDKFYDQLRKLGISGDETFQTLNDELQETIASGGDAIEAFNKQVEELAKRINFNRLPKDQRTIKLEAAINKYATDKNLNEWSREVMIALANQKYHVSISTLVDKKSQNQASLDLMNWRDNLQDYFNKHSFQIGVDLKTAAAGEIAQKAGSEYEARKASVQAIQNQLAYSKAQLAIEEKRLKTVPAISKDYASRSASVNVSRAAVASLTKELEKAKNEVTEGREAAKRAGYDFKKENSEAEKSIRQRTSAHKKALSEEAQAIKNEIDLIDKLSSNYDKLTGAGMSKETVISFLAKEYKRSIGDINNVLTKYKLPKFDVSTYITETAGKGLSGQVTYLEKLRDAMKSKRLDKLKPDAFKQVSLQIEKVKVEGKVYDMTMVTDGLQNALNNIKESYELGVEIDADPQMGELFLKMFKIDPKTLIRTAEDAVKALQDEWDKKSIDYNKINPQQQIGTTDLMTTKPEDLAKSLGLKDSDKIISEYKSFYDYAHKIREDDFKSVKKSWDDLLSKYAEYEYKRNDIQKTTAKQRLELIQKFGTNEEYKQALDLSNKIQISDDPKVIVDLQKQLSDVVDKVTKGKPKAISIATAITSEGKSKTADLNFSEYQKTEYWQAVFGDMNNLSDTAISKLISNFEGLKTSMKDLTPTQVKELNKAIENLKKTQGERNPFKQLADSFEDIRKKKTALAKAKDALNAAKETGDANKIRKAEEGVFKAQEDLTEANEKQGMSAKKIVQVFGEMYNSCTALKEAFGDTADAAIQAGISIATSVITVIEAIKNAQNSVAILAIIQAALTAINFIVSAITGGKNKKIDKQIKDSEVRVKELENAYKSLDRAITQAMGDAEIGAKKAAIANKELQLVELQRQLSLEESRSGKKRDKSKIADLKGQIIDLKNSITDLTNSIVTDMLGISSAKDAAESLVLNMIEAFRNGEDYMKEYTQSFDKMIDNMIMKAIVSKVIGDKIEELMNTLQKKADERASKYSSDLASATAASQETDEQIAQGLRNAERKRVFDELYVPDENDPARDEYNRQYAQAQADAAGAGLKITKEDIDAQRKIYEDYLKKVQGQISTATAITPDEVSEVTGDIKDWKNGVKTTFEDYMKAFGITYGQDKTSDLSGLQQGIQNITETQAGAIEAYMNGISGQVYLHTSLLQSLLNNSNVSMGLQSQMLLQMQQGYQVQTSIQSMLNGWSSNNGRSVRVEMA